MNFRLVAVGKIKESFLKKGIAEYTKRISNYGKLEIVEIKDEPFSEPLSGREQSLIKDKEGEKILAALPARSFVIALDRTGTQLTSEQFSQKLADLALHGNSHFTLVIGGALGLSKKIITDSDYRLSFSKFTFPHQLMRLILVEQLYRACTIQRGEKYHK